jgi:hypothetical protein
MKHHEIELINRVISLRMEGLTDEQIKLILKQDVTLAIRNSYRLMSS